MEPHVWSWWEPYVFAVAMSEVLTEPTVVETDGKAIQESVLANGWRAIREYVSGLMEGKSSQMASVQVSEIV